MEENMNILPPDRDIFHEAKKPVSNKQKEHLVKARQSAKQTIERRRLLEQEAKQKEAREKEEDEPEEEEDDPDPPVVKRQVKKSSKVVSLSEEEYDARKFEKFMKNMNNYEKLKEQHRLDAEEAKKVKISLSQDEYEHMCNLLELEQKNKQLAIANPVEPKQREAEPDQVRRVVSHIAGRYNNQSSRFGNG